MKDELEQELCKKYPKIFKDARQPDPLGSQMHWGIAVGDGWYNVINSGCALIQNHINHTRKNRARALWYNRAIGLAKKGNTKSLFNIFANKDGSITKWQQDQYGIAVATMELKEVKDACEQLIATQVKEKFGGLRFYYQGGDDYTGGIVDMMENMSNVTCDSCGAPGAAGGGGWITVKCGACRIGFKRSIEEYENSDE